MQSSAVELTGSYLEREGREEERGGKGEEGGGRKTTRGYTDRERVRRESETG